MIHPVTIVCKALEMCFQFALWTSILRAKHTFEREHLRKSKSKKAESEGEETKEEDDYVPKWFNKYVEYKFNLYDRAGNTTLGFKSCHIFTPHHLALILIRLYNVTPPVVRFNSSIYI